MGKHARKAGLGWDGEPVTIAPLNAHEVAGERAELLARKHSGQKLSPSDQERLDLLSARLKEILPPVSVAELEALLEMSLEVQSIRDRARERRRRLG